MGGEPTEPGSSPAEQPFELSDEDHAIVGEAQRLLREKWAARPADADDQPVDERFNGPVFVDGAGNLQHEPTPEGAARHAEFLRRSAYYERLRRERGEQPPPPAGG